MGNDCERLGVPGNQAASPHQYRGGRQPLVMLCGIDPGLCGALAVIDHAGALVAIADTPTLTLRVARGVRRDYDVPGMCGLVAPYAGADLHVVIEQSQAMPGQGTRSMFTCGYGYGLWLGILAALQVPYTVVRPTVWKKALGLGKDKEQSRLKAQQLFPSASLRRKRDHGRAEALLLGWYAQHLYRPKEPA